MLFQIYERLYFIPFFFINLAVCMKTVSFLLLVYMYLVFQRIVKSVQ